MRTPGAGIISVYETNSYTCDGDAVNTACSGIYTGSS